jgi:hypothetical protein
VLFEYGIIVILVGLVFNGIFGLVFVEYFVVKVVKIVRSRITQGKFKELVKLGIVFVDSFKQRKKHQCYPDFSA